MKLDEAIKHCEEVANANQRLCETVSPDMQLSDYSKCAEEHRQLAEWLKDYKRLLEQEPCENAISRQAVDTFDTTQNDNICNSCIHKSVCKFNTVCRVDTGDTCSAYEPASICHLCSKSNSCEVKTYPISKCKQHYYSQKPRLNKIREEINNISGKIIIEDYVEYGSNCPKYVPLEEVLRVIDKCESEEAL